MLQYASPNTISPAAKVSSQEELDNSFNALQNLTNQSYVDIDLLDRSMPVLGPTPTPLNDWVDSALTNNHQLAAQKHQLEAAKQRVRAEKSGHLPTFDATARYSHSEEGGTNGSALRYK